MSNYTSPNARLVKLKNNLNWLHKPISLSGMNVKIAKNDEVYVNSLLNSPSNLS